MMGTAVSKGQLFTLCSVPGTPYPAPISDKSLTTTSQISVSFANLNPDNGGC